MQVKAQLKNLRISPRKVRLVSDLIKGQDAISAKYRLEHLAKKSSKPIVKLLESALANAHNNFSLAKENLFIKEINVDEAPKLKRFRPKGFGSTSPIEKKSSSIRIILEEKIPGLKPTKETGKQAVKHTEKGEFAPTENEAMIDEKNEQIQGKAGQAKPEIKKELGKKSVFGKISKRIFQRKTI